MYVQHVVSGDGDILDSTGRGTHSCFLVPRWIVVGGTGFRVRMWTPPFAGSLPLGVSPGLWDPGCIGWGSHEAHHHSGTCTFQ